MVLVSAVITECSTLFCKRVTIKSMWVYGSFFMYKKYRHIINFMILSHFFFFFSLSILFFYTWLNNKMIQNEELIESSEFYL